MNPIPDISLLRACSPFQKRAVLKIAIELVKADDKIHRKEISLLEGLQKGLSLTQGELDLIHYLTLADAVDAVRRMDDATVVEVMGVFNSIMRADSDIDFEENLLLSAVSLSCRPESRAWASVLSVPAPDIDIPDRQIAYLEKEASAQTHDVLDDPYDNLLISKAFGDIGLELFYLPNVLADLGRPSEDGKFALLRKSMGYLMPAGDLLETDSLRRSLDAFDSSAFFKVVTSRFGLTPEAFPFDAFLLVRIRDGAVLDDDNSIRPSIDFFCLDISTEVKKRILSFVSFFEEQTQLIPYDGYYKILYDHFSAESKLNSRILLDRDFGFRLESFGNRRIAFESSPQARTLYLLLLRFGRDGIGQETFHSASAYLDRAGGGYTASDGTFDLPSFERDLLSGDEPWRTVIFDTVRIYRAISTKDEQKVGFLSYIGSILSHRSSLKTYINKGFSSVRGLSDPDMYQVEFDRETNAYRVGLGLSMFLAEEDGKTVPLKESRFWKSLL